jgi:hypothetical protein
MIRDQSDLHRPLVKVSDRELRDTVFDYSSRDRERVDLI